MSEEIYNNHFGTSFGFSLTKETGMEEICNGIYTNAHSFRDFGLHPAEKPVIKTPEKQESEIEVTGRDGPIDTSEALDGMPHYLNREGTWRFSALGGRSTWGTIYTKLKNELHGKVKDIVLDEEPTGYYRGRITVEEPEYDDKKGVAYFELSANLEPWKYDFTETDEDWLWDPFDFETGIIREYGEIVINNGASLTIYGSKIPLVPDLIVSAGSLTVEYTVNGTAKSVVLVSGTDGNIDNTPDLVLREFEEKTLIFSGSGTLKIKYKTGVL